MKSCAVALAIFVAFDGQLDQAVQQLRVGQATGFPELGVHADFGEAGHGIDLVDVDFACLFLKKEVYTREAAEVERGEGEDGLAANLFGQLLRNIRRDHGL